MPMQPPAALARARDAVAGFTAGQKVVSLLVLAGLVLGGVAFTRWVSTPSMVPLFTNLAASDAAAIVEQLDAEGVAYELASGGSSVMVPQENVYQLRLKLSAEGLPSAEETGYALLDQQGVTTSQFQQQVTYQRAMEGELASTIGAISGVQGATVHLAVPEKDVFLSETGKPTASVLVETAPGAELGRRQVEAVVNLVASAVQELDPADVTVVDGEGRLLSTDAAAGGTAARDEETADYESRLRGQLQTMLDQVLGKGAAVATVTAELDLDATDTTSERFVAEDGVPPLSTSRTTEQYEGSGGTAAGVLGPDNIQVPAGQAGTGTYRKDETTSDNAVGKVTERRVGAPGDVVRQSVAVVVDTSRAGTVDVADLTALVTTSAGIDAARGDTVTVSRMPFDTAAADAATQAGEAAAERAAAERQSQLVRTLVLAGVVLLLLGIAGFGAWRRRRKQARDVVHDLPWERVQDPAPALASLTAGGEGAGPEPVAALPTRPDPAASARAEVEALVERQPDEVAELLRGWLADRRS